MRLAVDPLAMRVEPLGFLSRKSRGDARRPVHHWCALPDDEARVEIGSHEGGAVELPGIGVVDRLLIVRCKIG